MGSAVQSSPLTSTLTMRAFLTVFLAVAVCGEADPYTIGQVLTGQTNGGAITHVDYGHGLPKVAGFPYTAVHTVAPVVHHAAVVAPTGLGHAVAVTGYGHVTHSSNVGVCTNVAGVQVPC